MVVPQIDDLPNILHEIEKVQEIEDHPIIHREETGVLQTEDPRTDLPNIPRKKEEVQQLQNLLIVLPYFHPEEAVER